MPTDPTDPYRARARELLCLIGAPDDHACDCPMPEPVINRVAAELRRYAEEVARLRAERDAALRMISCEHGRSRTCVEGDACFGHQVQFATAQRDAALARVRELEAALRGGPPA